MSRTHRRFHQRWAAVIVATAMAVGIPLGASPASAAVKPHVLFGAHVSPRWGLGQVDTYRRFEAKVGRKFALANRFQHLSEIGFLFPDIMLRQGRIPMISWRATDSRINPDPNRAMKIARGDFDAQIRRAADGAKAVKGSFLLRFAWEMTQGEGQTQYIGTPAEFIAAWRHVVSIFDARGATNVRWVWAPHARSFCKGRGQAYYPGDAWVDWIGGSAVPANTFTSFHELFHCFYSWASHRPKKLLVENGVRENPADPGWKAGFIRGARVTLRKWPRISAFIYFHSVNVGYNWRADSSAAALNAYRAMACDPYFAKRIGCG